MALIVTLIALLIERFFDFSHLRHWYWFTTYQRMVWKRMRWDVPYLPYLFLALTILPILIVVMLLQWLLHGWLYGFIRLVFDLFIMLYCFGPQNLWADAFVCLNALTQGDTNKAAEKLKTAFGITGISHSQSLHKYFLDTIFVQGERRIFGVIFWYMVFGPFGAVLYRTIALSAEEQNQAVIPEISQAATVVESILDWIPARILTFIFGLGGHFVQVFACWRKKVLLGLNANEMLLTECGIAALGIEDKGKVLQDGTAENHAISLLDRSFVIILVIIAIIIFLT